MFKRGGITTYISSMTKRLVKFNKISKDKATIISKEAKRNGEYLTHKCFEKKLFSDHSALNLIAFTEKYMTRNPDQWGKNTKHSYEGLVKLWRGIYASSIDFNDLATIREVMEKAMVKNGNSLNTRKKRHKQTKSMIARAMKEYTISQPYTEPIGEIKGNRNFLDLEELKKAIRLYQSWELPNNLQETLGQFLFVCFTGPRYSDMVEMHSKHIVGDVLEYIAVKTKRFEKRVQAPMPAVAKSLIKNRHGKLFDMATGQTVNRHLKRIFKRLNINKHITFHCGRHTFATLYIYLGGDITNLQEILAHEDISTTQIYVKMAKRLELKDLTLFDNEFAKDMRVITSGRAEYLEVI